MSGKHWYLILEYISGLRLTCYKNRFADIVQMNSYAYNDIFVFRGNAELLILTWVMTHNSLKFDLRILEAILILNVKICLYNVMQYKDEIIVCNIQFLFDPTSNS